MGLSWHAGVQLEKEIVAQIEGLRSSHPWVSVADLSVERGLLSTRVAFVARLNAACFGAEAGSPAAAKAGAMAARFDATLRHGPLVFMGGARFGAASYVARVSSANGADSAASQGAEPFATMRGSLGRDGAYEWSMEGPASSARAGAGSRVWDGLKGYGRGNWATSDYEVHIEAPHGAVEGGADSEPRPSSEIRGLKLRLKSESGLAGAPASEMLLEIEGLKSVGPGPESDAATLSKLKAEIKWHAGAEGLALGSARILVGRLDADNAISGRMAATDLDYSVAVDEREGFVSLSLGASAGGYKVSVPAAPGEVFEGGGELLIELSRLDAPSLALAKKALSLDMCSSTRADAVARARAVDWRALGLKLLAGKPVLSVKRARVSTPMGSVGLSGALWLGDSAGPAGPTVDDLHAKFELQWDDKMLGYALGKGSESNPGAELAWRAFLARGMAKRTASGYATSIEASGGALRVNGVELGGPALGALMGPRAQR